MTGPHGVPVAVWTGALATAGALGSAGTAAAVLHATGSLTSSTLLALAAGAVVGLLTAVLAVVAAVRVATGLRSLRDEALVRLRTPDAPLGRADRPLVARASSELAELADVLDALHARVRLADQLGAQHRRDVQTAGAGVFELLSGLVAAEEGARGQLAAELHDTVAQSLVIARNLLTAGPASAEELRRLGDYVADAEEQLRGVMARTRPPALREGDLARAVQDLQADLQARYGLEVTVLWPASPRPLPASLAVILYRFFQEALLNVVKHADVDQAVLELALDGDQLLATVHDDGPGFDPALVRPTGGRQVGLGLLRERARLAGGLVEVVSQPCLGTTLRLSLRLPPVPTAVPSVPAQRQALQRR